MTDTRQALAALLPCPFCGNSKGLAVANENPQDLSGGYFIACPSCDASTGLRFACGEDPIPLLIEQWNRRAALAAQPVAGAVATEAQLNSACMSYRHDFGLMTPDEQERLRWSAKEWLHAWRKEFALSAQAAPAPEPSAQAVAELPDEIRVPLHRLWADAGYLIGRAKTGDTDLAVHTIKALCDELERAIRAALAAAPQPEPSAQGEPVALPAYGQMKWDELIAAVCEAQTGNRAVGWERDPSYYVGHQPVSINMNSLNRIVSGFVARASAPSTLPHAVVEAVPMESWPIERAADMLTAYAELVKANGRYAEEHYIPEIENVAAELRGIAPKAAQPVEGER